MKYSKKEVTTMLQAATFCVDTREKNGEQLQSRLLAFKCPVKHIALSYGDYTIECIECRTRQIISLSSVAAIERKSSLAELAINFTKRRQQFTNEFNKAKKDGCRLHLLVENDSYEQLYKGAYNSQMTVAAFVASLHTWAIRYNSPIHFCGHKTSGQLIHDILYYELREYLLNIEPCL